MVSTLESIFKDMDRICVGEVNQPHIFNTLRSFKKVSSITHICIELILLLCPTFPISFVVFFLLKLPFLVPIARH